MRGAGFACAALILLLTIPEARAAEPAPGNSCTGNPTNSFQWAGGPENAGSTSGMFCNGSTWTGVIDFQSTGNVGIGTTTPVAALDVEATANPGIRIYAPAQYTGLSIVTYGGQPVAALGGTSSSNNDNGALYLFWGGSANVSIAANSVSYINNYANFGIGTTSPQAQLDVGGEIRTTGNTLACSSTTTGALRYNSSTKAFDYCGGSTPAWTAFGGGAGTPAGSDQQIQFNNAGAFGASSNLTFSYGTNQLTNKGQIYAGKSGGASLTFNVAGNSWATFYDPSLSGSNGGIAIGGSSAITTVPTSPTMFWNVNTNSVGVATTSPQATLDVSGYMRLTKYSSQPVACSSTNDGAVALTHIYTLCICKGGSSSWVQSKDGSTVCSW